MTKTVVFDIGGSGIKYSINDLRTFETISKENIDKEFVLNFISKTANENNADTICISSPAIIDSNTGFIKGLSAIDNWSDFNLFDELKILLKNKNTKIYVDNDGNCALLGSVNKLNKKVHSAISIVYGTGVGGSIYIDNKIFKGFNNSSGEFGMFIDNFDNDINKNLSTQNSTVSLCKLVNDKLSTDYNGKDIMKLYENKDEDVFDIVDTWFKRNATLIYNLVWAIDPEYLIIGGAIAENEIFQKNINKKVDELFAKINLKKGFEIVFSTEGNLLNLYGAYCLKK